MLKFFLSIFVIFCLFSCSSTLNKNKQPPKWLNESYRNNYFPKDQYYVVYNEKNLKDFTSKSKEDIKKEFSIELENQLVKQIQDKISIRTASSDLQTNANKIDYISSVLRESSQTASAKLMGKKEESFLEKKKISMMIYVKKSDLVKGYNSILTTKIGTIKNKISYYLSVEKEDGISPLGDLNTDYKSIQEDMDIYTILSSPDSTLTNNFNDMSSLFLQLNVKYGYDKMKIEGLIFEADRMYQNHESFENIIDKLNEALIYEPSNIKVLDKKKEYNQKWASKLTLDLDSKVVNKDYLGSINVLDKLIVIDANNESVYRGRQKNIIELFFRETIEKINRLINNSSIDESSKLIGEISKFSYVDSVAFNKVKLELDKLIIENAIRTINNLIYEKNYYQAANVCSKNFNLYPDNRQLKNLFDKVLDIIQVEKKKELKAKRSTRYVIELNYSLSHLPQIVQDKTSLQPVNFDVSKIDVNKPLGYYQIGLYRKINIKEKTSTEEGKHRFSYSQIGVKGGYLDLSTNYFQTNTTTGSSIFLYKPSKLIQIEASYIWRRFFQFNLGIVKETLPEIKSDLSLISKENSYFCSTIGFRIPFNFIHLTADVTGFSDGKDIVKLYAKAGISMSIGFSKRYNGEDKKYIQNEVIKLKN